MALSDAAPYRPATGIAHQETMMRLRCVVDDVLQELRGEPVLFFPNRGNAGDALINVGAMHCFDRLGLDYRPITIEDDVTGKTVLLGGGGNLVPPYVAIKRALQKFHKRAKRIILLPHTIRGHEELIGELGNNCLLIARDVETYRRLLELPTKSTTVLAHDMAFHLELDRLTFDRKARETYEPLFYQRLRDRKINFSDVMNRPSVTYARKDGEATGVLGGAGYDISALMAWGTQPGEAEISSWAFLEMIRLSPPIRTDRLHVGIGSAILGKKCTLHDNNYGKNKGVFVHSIRNHLGTVTMAEEAKREAA